MKKISLLLILGLFILTSQTVSAQFKLPSVLKKAKEEAKKSKLEEEKQEKEKIEQEEQEKAKKEKEEREKDHPLVSRFEGAEMKFYKETKWGSYKLPVSAKGTISWGNPMVLEGKVTRIQYTVSKDNNSEFVLHNYKAAFKKSGFEVLIAIANEKLGVSDRPHTWRQKYYESGGFYNGLNNGKFGMGLGIPNWINNHCFIAARGHDNNQDVYAIIYAVVTSKYTLIIQDVIEVEVVETGLVSAANISKDISTQGYIAIYGINFETGKSEIKASSEATLKNIAEYINSVEDKKFFIVGHTDNIGDFSSNMTLSEERAKSVMIELTTKYSVKAKQLGAYGVSSLSPIASNLTDEGKAKNRRVEIVEQ
jgi:outer membrane protein OmpA-like peptidoglycan-associated protein